MIQSQKQTSIWSNSLRWRINCQRITLTHYGKRHVDVTEYMMSANSKVFIEGFSEAILHSMCSYWGWKKNDTVRDLACYEISLTKLEQGLRITNAPVTTTRQIPENEILDAKEVMLKTSICARPRQSILLSRGHCYLHLDLLRRQFR